MRSHDTFHIRQAQADDWVELRRLRLEMLADTPLAFLETLDQASRLPDDVWRERAIRGASETRPTMLAVDRDGTIIGMMRGEMRAERPFLAGVYVTEVWRGRTAGVSDKLLAAICSWAAARADHLSLFVHEDNRRAALFYERHGFRYTGATTPYQLPPYGLELEMRRTIVDMQPHGARP